MLKHYLICLFFTAVQCTSVSATTYYVSRSHGNDALDGKSEINAWRTIVKVNGTEFSAGDSILFRRGDTWRETLIVTSSGTPGSYITIGNYGTGDNPAVYGSETSDEWTRYSGNIWVSSSTFTNPRADFLCEIFFIEKDGAVSWGLYRDGTGSLTAERDWTWSGDKIYIYSATDPVTGYSGIEIPQRQACLDLHNREYIDINGIDLSYGIYEGITYDWKYPQLELYGLIIENCRIGYIGGNITEYTYENGFGIDVAYSDMIVRDCEIHNCGRRGISFHLYGSGFTVRDVLIEKNYFHDGHHTTGVDISVGSGSYTGNFDGITIRRNMFYDPPTSPFHSVEVFIQNYNYADLRTSVNNIYIYSNIFKSPTAAAVMAEGAQSVFVYNNTFYNHNVTKSGNDVHLWLDANNVSVKVKNNIFYTELDNDNSGNGLEIYCLTDYRNIDADYNLYYRINSSLRIITANSKNYTMNNLAAVQSQLGWEKHSPEPADPKFIDTADNNFNLDSSSVARGKGINLNVPVDYYGNEYNEKSPSIGACEFSGDNNTPSDGNDEIIVLYPNPAHDYLTIWREGSDLKTRNVRIIDFAGKVVFKYFLKEGTASSQIPLNIGAGLYVVQFLDNEKAVNSQKLIVVK